MSPETFNIVLSSIILPLLGVVIGFMVWSQRRMDKKDERFAEQSNARAEENMKERETFVNLASKFVATTEDRADKFYSTAQTFDFTVREFLEKSCSRIDDLSKCTLEWKNEWDAAEERDAKAVRVLQGGFIDNVAKEHQSMLKANQEVAEYHKAETQRQLLMIEDLRLVGKALGKLCDALDIKINGNGKTLSDVWDGHDRREQVMQDVERRQPSGNNYEGEERRA